MPLLRPKYRAAIEQRTYLDLTVLGQEKPYPVGRPDVLVVEGEQRRPLSTATAAPPATTPFIAELPAFEDVLERYLEIRTVGANEVVTVIEVLSPSNKRPASSGRREYEDKRNAILTSHTHLVEIDLLRGGEPMAMRLPPEAPKRGYRIMVSRAGHRPRADVYAFTLRDPIPDFPVPLLWGDLEPTIPLN